MSTNYRENPDVAVKNQLTVVDLIQNQLHSMNTLLAATMLKIGIARSSQSPGIIVNNNFNPPDLVIQMLQKMSTHTSEMTQLIGQLQDRQVMEVRAAELEKRSWKSVGLATLAIGIASGIGILIAKQWRGAR